VIESVYWRLPGAIYRHLRGWRLLDWRV